MIITWFTDPSGGNIRAAPHKLSSYYHYDTETMDLVRIRLELQRKKATKDTRSTAVFLNEKRIVGFYTGDDLLYVNKHPDSSFRIVDGQIQVSGQPLKQLPVKKDLAVDMGSMDNSIHIGSEVTLKPNLPPGITLQHLNLLVNKALDERRNVMLTTHNVSPIELARRIRAVALEQQQIEHQREMRHIIKKMSSLTIGPHTSESEENREELNKKRGRISLGDDATTPPVSPVQRQIVGKVPKLKGPGLR
ncbi:MAG: hypothetical protein AAGB24_10770 [Bacteroidota bacterium]